MRLDCGIRLERIRTWLGDELGLVGNDARWTFVYEGHECLILLAPLENRVLGKASIERAELNVEGDPEALDEFMRLFTLRFVSAGG